SIGEGEEMGRGIEASNQIGQTGTQQRSWEHWMLGKQIVASGRVGQARRGQRWSDACKQIVHTGTQQRSWEHWMLGKQIVDSGRLGQITFVHTYWYQHMTAGNFPPVAVDKAGWRGWG